MCVENNEPIENKDTYIFDLTTTRYILDFDRNEPCDDIIDQGVATVSNSYSVDFVHDDIANVSRHEVALSEYQICAKVEVESYVSNNDFDVADPTLHGKVVHDEECESKLSQS